MNVTLMTCGRLNRVDIILPSGKTVRKNVDDDLRFLVDTHKYISVSDRPMQGYRKHKLNIDYNYHGIESGYRINCQSAGSEYIYVCKKGLRAIGFKNTDYVYVKFGRKV